PGYDWLVATTPYTCWPELPATRHWPDVERFLATAVNLDYAQRTRTMAASRVLMRLLVETGGPITAITEADVRDLEQGARARMGGRGFSASLHAPPARRYHL